MYELAYIYIHTVRTVRALNITWCMMGNDFPYILLKIDILCENRIGCYRFFLDFFLFFRTETLHFLPFTSHDLSVVQGYTVIVFLLKYRRLLRSFSFIMEIVTWHRQEAVL
jgi:hypothetical protein